MKDRVVRESHPVILTSCTLPGEEGSAGGFLAPGFGVRASGLVARQGRAPRNDKRIRRRS
jgi:hypothetical protein